MKRVNQRIEQVDKKTFPIWERNLCSDPGLSWETQGRPIRPLLGGSEVAFETWAQKAFPNRERSAFPNRERIPGHLYHIFLNLLFPFFRCLAPQIFHRNLLANSNATMLSTPVSPPSSSPHPRTRLGGHACATRAHCLW